MDIEKTWNKALKQTEIIRSRVQPLMTMADTRVPYVLLAESSINLGDTVVRKGEVVVQKPAIIIPPNNPQLYGFEFGSSVGENENNFINFLIVRGVTIPSLRYDNQTHSLDIFEGKLSKAVSEYQELLQRKEDVHTGLIVGPEDGWQFSLLIFICMQVARNTENDIRKLLEDFKNRNRDK